MLVNEEYVDVSVKRHTSGKRNTRTASAMNIIQDSSTNEIIVEDQYEISQGQPSAKQHKFGTEKQVETSGNEGVSNSLEMGAEVLELDGTHSSSSNGEDHGEGEESEESLQRSAASSRFLRDVQDKYDDLKHRLQDQEEKIKDVLIVPKRMEYKIDGLRSELKEQLEQFRSKNAGELKQMETYVQTLHSDLQAAQEALRSKAVNQSSEEVRTSSNLTADLTLEVTHLKKSVETFRRQVDALKLY